MTRYGEDEADDFFRQDALRQGYLKQDPHAPGNGQGLRAYYRDQGMVQPEELKELTKGKRSKETTSLEFDEMNVNVHGEVGFYHCPGCRNKRNVSDSTVD